MREYICDKCGRQLKEKASIKDGQGKIIFPTEYEPIDGSRRMYAAFDIKLKSNTWSDLCVTCIMELIAENIMRK